MKYPISFFVFLSVLSASAIADFKPKNRPYDVQRYTLRLSLNPAETLKEFHGELEIALTLKAPTDTIELDREALTVTKVEQKGAQKPLTFSDSDPALLPIKLARTGKAGDKLTLKLHYNAQIGENHRGFFRVKDPDAPERGHLFFTHFEPLAAKSFFPCNDEPYDKAAVEMVVSVPAGYEAVSNGKLTRDRKFTQNKAAWHELTWKQEKPHSTYLVALAVGKFKMVEHAKAKPPITAYANQNKIARADYTLDVTYQSMKAFEEYLGVSYPWDKYATVGLPTFLWGGMENTSSTHMNEERMLLNDPSSAYEKNSIVGLVSHELAHQWFGDLVTMRWWNDVWLNEAFATFMSIVAEKKIFKNEGAEFWLVAETYDSYFKDEDGPRSHAIVTPTIESPDDAFDSTNYTKGANVLRMLSYYLGEERFRKALKLYLTTYGGANTSYLDLFKSLELATGEDLTAFRDSWLLQRGYPVVTYSGNWDKKTSKYELTLKQTPNHPEDKSIWRFRMPITFHRKAAPAYQKTVAFPMGEAERKVKFDLPAEPELVSVNTGSVVLARVKQEGQQEKEVAVLALGDPDPLSRFTAAFDLAEGLREGKEVSRFAEKTLAYVIQSDASPYVRSNVLEMLQRSPAQKLPAQLSETILTLAQESMTANYEQSERFRQDPLGWSRNRSILLGSLGKVGSKEAMALLQKAIENPALPQDDVMESTKAVAQIGGDDALGILKNAQKIHAGRGYRYRYFTEIAFASLRDTRAVGELKRILASATPDLAGRIARPISNNPQVKGSPEWAGYLREFLLDENRFGEEVKARILTSVEHEKTPELKTTLETVVEKSTSERLRALSKQILAKNFAGK